MSYTHLRPREYYENRYDDGTVEICRRGEHIVNQTFIEMQKKVPAKEIQERKPGWYLQYSIFYFSLVELPAAKRYAERDEVIAKWMQQDEAKDRRLAEAHIAGGMYCRNCGKDMHVVSKDYMRRDGRKEEDILLMFECDACDKRSAFWQDGTEWEGVRIKCKKCGGDTTAVHKTEGKVITTVRTCSDCGNAETEVMDLSADPAREEEPANPYYELDHKRFVFTDSMMSKFQQKAHHLERMRQLHAQAADRVERVDIYSLVKDVKKLKIAQVAELLTPVLTKQKYTEFKLGEPQIGREVSLDFSCLDADADREEYQSAKQLRKAIEKALSDSNWRLMSDGVSYRLGFLSGRLRAYESEEELKQLVEQRIKKGTLKLPMKESAAPPADEKPKYEGMQLREAALVYMDKMMLGTHPAEITLKSGKKKRTGIPYITAEINPALRVFIPMRVDDKSVPEFVRTFDFKMGPNVEKSKVTKDSLGREIKLL